jgi:hypothetical protein
MIIETNVIVNELYIVMILCGMLLEDVLDRPEPNLPLDISTDEQFSVGRNGNTAHPRGV